VVIADIHKIRPLDTAGCLGVTAPGVKTASGRRIDGARDFAFGHGMGPAESGVGYGDGI